MILSWVAIRGRGRMTSVPKKAHAHITKKNSVYDQRNIYVCKKGYCVLPVLKIKNKSLLPINIFSICKTATI